MVMPNEVLIKDLERIVGKENISVSPMDLKAYAYVQGTGGDMIGPKRADVIVIPKNTEEVSGVVKLANRFKVPIVPQGARAKSWGMNVAHKGGIVVDMARVS